MSIERYEVSFPNEDGEVIKGTYTFRDDNQITVTYDGISEHPFLNGTPAHSIAMVVLSELHKRKKATRPKQG